MLKRSRLLFVTLFFFAVLFTLTACLQYWFIQTHLNETITKQFREWADEISEDVSDQGKWDLEAYRRSAPEAPMYWVVTMTGLIIDIEIGSFVPGMVPTLSIPSGVVYDHPFDFVSAVGEHWRLFAKKVDGGTVLLGAPNTELPPDIDARFNANLGKFGTTVKTAEDVADRELDLMLDFAVVDDSGVVRHAVGGVPLMASSTAIDALAHTGPLVEIDGEPYFQFSRSIPGGEPGGTALGRIFLLRNVTLEQRLLHQSLIFNGLVAALSWLISGVLIAVHFYRQRSPRITCEDALRARESNTIEFKSSMR
jgi:hypothetical protein